MLAQNHVFNFQSEIMEYCYADVALLAAAMTKFEQGFKTFNVCLFSESLTQASVATKVFMRQFLEPNVIALDMAPRGVHINESVIASRYLNYREEKEGLTIQRANNIGQYMVITSFFPKYLSISRYPEPKSMLMDISVLAMPIPGD